MKTELYATSVTDVSFHFSELGCHVVTYLFNTFLPLTRKIFLPLTGGILQATPSTSFFTTPKPEPHLHVLSLLEHLSCIFLCSQIGCKTNTLQSEHTSLLPCHIPSFPLPYHKTICFVHLPYINPGKRANASNLPPTTSAFRNLQDFAYPEIARES